MHEYALTTTGVGIGAALRLRKHDALPMRWLVRVMFHENIVRLGTRIAFVNWGRADVNAAASAGRAEFAVNGSVPILSR